MATTAAAGAAPRTLGERFLDGVERLHAIPVTGKQGRLYQTGLHDAAMDAGGGLGWVPVAESQPARGRQVELDAETGG